ncbi:hypothetical protein KCU88_g142, partial [Aureobasidium melanogenum]
MVRNHSVGGIDAILVLVAKFAGVRSGTGNLLDAVEQRSKDVRIVVGQFVLEDTDESLETHARVDVFVGQRAQTLIRLPVVLNKHVVPDLQHVRIVLVDETGSIAPASDSVIVNFGTRTTWTLVTHFPEISSLASKSGSNPPASLPSK